ncbi:hypothetical protein D3C80_2133610 [compost metagenome]
MLRLAVQSRSEYAGLLVLKRKSNLNTDEFGKNQLNSEIQHGFELLDSGFFKKT